MWGCACVVQRPLARAGAVGARSAWVMSTVVAQVPIEVGAEGGFQQRNAVCRIRGVGDHRRSEDVPRWQQLQYVSGTATYHG
jgi:hypothetical protein